MRRDSRLPSIRTMRLELRATASRAAAENSEVVTNTALVGIRGVDRSGKLAHGTRSDTVARGIFLGLHINLVQAKRVLADGSIDPAVIRTANDAHLEPRGLGTRPVRCAFTVGRRRSAAGASAYGGCVADDKAGIVKFGGSRP